jgi:hypothetical protein
MDVCVCELCSDPDHDRAGVVHTVDPVGDSDLGLLSILVRDPTVTTGEATQLLGLPDIPDEDDDATRD